LFAVALPLARRIYLTEVDAAPDGDVFFPEFDEAAFDEVTREAHQPGEKDDHPFVYRVLERKR
jgi:dihydrofolate reductase